MPANPQKITDAVVELTIDMLARRVQKGDIKRVLKERFALVARGAERALSRARAEMLKRTGAAKDDHRANAMQFYESIIRATGQPAVFAPSGQLIRAATPGPTVREKLIAQERIDALLGLEVPQRVELTGSGGGAIKAIVGIDPSLL